MSDPVVPPPSARPERIVVFGVSGHLGRELLTRLGGSAGGELELVGVVSPESFTTEFEYRGETLDARLEWPRLRAGDLVFVCTPGAVALEVVREALRAEVPCIDCTGALTRQAEVPMPVRRDELAPEARAALAGRPLLALPSATTLAWLPLLEALDEAAGVKRLVGTVLCSASALGRRGLMALSEESIALFNQSQEPETGPAGQSVAFDVVPGGIDETRVAAELARLFDGSLRVDVTSLQVPTFVGEGASLTIELERPLDEAAFAKQLAGVAGLRVVEEGFGSRGLAAVESDQRAPTGPTLRDALDSDEVLVGRVRPDASLEPGAGWRLWLAYDPLRLTVEHALRLAEPRLRAT